MCMGLVVLALGAIVCSESRDASSDSASGAVV
jgi:hypothetical protein